MGGKKSGRKSKSKQSNAQRAVTAGLHHPADISDDEDGATDVQPGPDKLAILAARSAAGEPLWHVDDLTVFRTGSELIGNRGDEHLSRRAGIQGTGRPKKKTRKRE